MKQVLQSYRSGELWLAEVPAPAAGAGMLLVKSSVTAISAGTEKMVLELAKKSLVGKAMERPDLVKKVLKKIKTEGFFAAMDKVWAKLDTPVPLGYSAAGTIVEVGADVSGYRPGDRVACGGAGYATHAEYNCAPRNLCVKVPEGVSDDDAAFTTLGAIALQAVRQADVRIGEDVGVIGLGLMGLLTVQILKAAGCRVVGIDPDESRCRKAMELGADTAVPSGASAVSFGSGRGMDAVIIAAATASNEPIETAAELCRAKGRIVVMGVVGMDVPRDSFYRKELDLRLSMSYGPGRYDPEYEERGHDYPYAYVRWTEQRNMEAFLNLVAAGKITPSKLITHWFHIDSALDAYDLIERRTQPFLGIVIRYNETTEAVAGQKSVSVRKTVPMTKGLLSQATGVGVIGAGMFAKGVLLPALKQVRGVELMSVCTATGSSAAETARKFGVTQATTDVEELLKGPAIGAVVIATRHGSHADLVCRALDAGKHVFVEKPLAVTGEQLDRVERAFLSRVNGGNARVLMVGYNRRFSPHAQAVFEAFSKRRNPMVVNCRVNAGSIPADHWIRHPEEGGGRIVGEVCHFVDLCSYLTGSQPERVWASCIGAHDSTVVPEDSLSITLDYADRSVATIQYVAVGSTDLPKERLEVFADGMSAVIEDMARTTFYGIKAQTPAHRQDKGFKNELEVFFRTVREGGPLPISIESLLKTTRTTFAIQESLRTGKPVSGF